MTIEKSRRSPMFSFKMLSPKSNENKTAPQTPSITIVDCASMTSEPEEEKVASEIDGTIIQEHENSSCRVRRAS
jgi:hypothetical protein